MDKEPLSRRQQEIYDYIKETLHEKGYAPSVRDITAAVGLASPSSVHVHLKTLETKGYIKRDAMKSRAILVLDDDEGPQKTLKERILPTCKITNIPLVGNVAAGSPILAEQNIEDSFSLPVDIVGDSASFMLTVRGDSMIECGINDGDYVVVREQKTVENGDIVVALVEDGATVKRFYREKNHIRLQPENSSMEPIITTDCEIAGKVVAVFRRL